MRPKGVQDMVDTIRQAGWAISITLCGSLYTGDELVQLGFSRDMLNEKKKELRGDLEKKLLPAASADSPKVEADLLDPEKDVFVLVFDGQHRYSQQSHRGIHVHQE